MMLVFMYTMYKDLGPNQSASGERWKRATKIQTERDASLRDKLGSKRVPAFPMLAPAFFSWLPTLEEMTIGDPLLCLLFVVKYQNEERRCLVLSNGDTASYESSDDAYRAIYDIGGATANITVHGVRA